MPSSVQPEIGPDALLVPLPPYEAYASDVERLDGRAPLGAADDAWLALAHTLARAAALPRGERGAVCAGGARLLALAAPDAEVDERAHAAVVAAADALGRAAAWFGELADEGVVDVARGALAEVVAALQVIIAQAEQAGAFQLAYSTLAGVRRALAPVLDARSRGLLLAQQGRVARQLGALAHAARLYRAAARAGRRGEAPDVVARALLGAGTLAGTRGNYPELRLLYRRALRAAKAARSPFLVRSSHHGLLMAAYVARDHDTALTHGGMVLRLLPQDATDERVELLINLGEVGRLAGEHRAALGAFLSAIEQTDVPRLRLAALGNAARVAAALGERKLLHFLTREVERHVVRSGQFENAQALVQLAEAFDGFDNVAALSYAARARDLALVGSFHEITDRAERVLGSVSEPDQSQPPAPVSTAGALTPRARAVLRTLEVLPAARRYHGMVAC